MTEHDILQAIIAITWLVGTGLVAANRYLLGCFFILAGLPAWWVVAEGQWGLRVVIGAMAVVYLLGIIGRWPRRPNKPLEALPDEHETNLGVG